MLLPIKRLVIAAILMGMVLVLSWCEQSTSVKHNHCQDFCWESQIDCYERCIDTYRD